jgi:acetyl-CoA carboxylase carboxyltransferase component
MPVLTEQLTWDATTHAHRTARTRESIAELRARHAQVALGGGPVARERHEARGKLFVRDRVETLLDPGTAMLELSPLAAHGMYGGDVAAAGIVCAIGHVHGRPCMVIANDATVKGGTYFPVSVRKHLRAQRIAAENRLPCIYLVDSGGAHLPLQAQMFADRDHGGRFFHNQARMSSAGIAQVACVMGSCTAGGAYVPAMCDETIIVEKTGTIFLAGPPLVRAATGERVTAEELGGADVHARISGVADHLARDDHHALAIVREILEHVPRAAAEHPWQRREIVEPLLDPELLDGFAPCEAGDEVELDAILACLLDGSELHEFKADYDASVRCGFAHLHGWPIGVLATRGQLTPAGARTAAHLVELCGQRGVPLLRIRHAGPATSAGDGLVDPTLVRAAAQLATVLACTAVPQLDLVVGAPSGGDAFAASAAPARLTWLWPGAHAADPDGVSVAGITALSSTAQVFDDGIVEPARTREVLALSLAIITTSATTPVEHAQAVIRM